MAMLQSSLETTDSVAGRKDERSLKALMTRSAGEIHLGVPMPFTADFSRVSKSDGDLSKYSNNLTTFLQDSSNLEYYDNAISKLALSNQQNNGRFDKDNKNSLDTTVQPRRHRRRKSNGSAERVRKKKDVERLRKKMEETHDAEGASEGDALGHRHTTQNSNKIKQTSGTPLRNSSRKKVQRNALSSYFSSPQLGTRQGRRSSKSTSRSIDTSSTTETRKQSNSTIRKKSSLNARVHDSTFADGVRKNSESFERKNRRTPRNSHMRNKMDGHHPTTPKFEGSTRKQFARRRSSTDVIALTRSDPGNRNDVSALTRSGSGNRNKPRRKYRHSISGSDDLNTHKSFSSLPKSPGAAISTLEKSSPNKSLSSLPNSHGIGTSTPEKSTANTIFIAESGLVTPYSVFKNPKYKSSAQSYSDRVMIAAESNKTPMSSLKKYLRDEKTLSASAIRVSGETRNLGRTPRISRKKPQTLLQIPFSDEASTAEMNEKREEEADSSKTTLGVHAFGKSVAKSMKKQAKITRRKIGRQISKMAPPMTAKSTTTISGTPLFDIDVSDPSCISKSDKDDGRHSPLIALKPPSGFFQIGKNNGKHDSPSSPLVALKPPSGLCRMDHDDRRHDSPLVALKPPSGNFRRKDTDFQYLDPPSGHCPKKKSGFQELSSRREISIQHSGPNVTRPPLLDGSELDQKQGYGKKLWQKNKTNGNHKSRQKTKGILKKMTDNQLEISVKSFVQINSDGELIFNDEDEEDSSIERSFKINPAINQKENLSEQPQPLLADGDLTVKDDDKVGSPLNIPDVSIAESSEQENLPGTPSKYPTPRSPTTKPKTFSQSQLTAEKYSYNFSERSNSSSISTLVTAPISPSRKSNTEKSFGNQNQHNDSQIDRNHISVDEDDQHQQQNSENASEHIVVPKNEETGEKEAYKIISKSPLPSQDTEILTEEAETIANNLTSVQVLNKEVSKMKEDDGLSQTVGLIIESEVSKKQEVRKHKKTLEAADLTSELIYLLKNGKSKKDNRAKERSEGTKESFEKHKKEKELRRIRRNQQQLINFDITVDSDPLDMLDMSEISNTLHTIEQRSPAKPRRNSMSESGSRSRSSRSDNTTKDRKSKTRRRGSKTKSRKKKEGSKSRSMTALTEQLIDPFV